MTSGSKASAPALRRTALAGLGAGAAMSSLLGMRIFAGFAAVALAVGAVLALGSLNYSGRIQSGIAAMLAMLFPLAVAEKGEGGILWAAAATGVVLGACYVARGLRPGILGSMAVGLAVVLHLGLLGSYLVLTVSSGNRLLIALVFMVTAFETAYGLLAARNRPASESGGSSGSSAKMPVRRKPIDPKAALGGVVACQGAAVLARFFLPSPLGWVSLLVLGAVVGGGASLGHAAAAVVSEDRGSRRQGAALDPEVLTQLNALLFASGAFYYGFRLYLA